MKSIYKMKYAMAAMVLLITSCQGSDLLEGGDKAASGNKVEHINATIQGLQSSRANTEGNGDAWTEGDMIELCNAEAPEGKRIANYKYNSSTGKFELTSSGYVVWDDSYNFFWACYPVFGKFAAILSEQDKMFNLPSDQTTIENLRSADLMFATKDVTEKPANNELSLQFEHQAAKLVVNITKYNDEYEDALPVISNPVFTSLTKTSNKEQFFNVPDVNIKGYMKEDETGKGLHTFMAILLPGKYSAGDVFLKFNVNGEELKVLANSTLTAGLENGKSYTFNLTVGKNKVSIVSVEVADWTGGINQDAGTADSISK